MGAYLALAVGTSLVGGVAGLGVEYSDLLRRALSGDGVAVKELARLVVFSDEFVGALARVVCGDPRRLSAELNTLLGLRDLLGSGVDIVVDLFRTESPLTGVSVEVIKRCIVDNKGWNVSVGGVYTIRLFGGSVHEGLNELMDKVGRRITHFASRGFATYVGITSGTKLEAIMMALVAWLLNAQPIYAGDDGGLVLLPRLPLRLSDDAVGVLKTVGEGLPDSRVYGDLLDSVKALELAGLVYRDFSGRYRVREWVKPLITQRG